VGRAGCNRTRGKKKWKYLRKASRSEREMGDFRIVMSLEKSVHNNGGTKKKVRSGKASTKKKGTTKSEARCRFRLLGKSQSGGATIQKRCPPSAKARVLTSPSGGGHEWERGVTT